MSRILRRPMFRGGPVDSRGTGITTGLDQPRIGARNGRFFGDTGNPFVPKPVTTQGIIDAYTPRGLPQSFIDFFRANQANQRPTGRFRQSPGATLQDAEGLYASLDTTPSGILRAGSAYGEPLSEEDIEESLKLGGIFENFGTASSIRRGEGEKLEPSSRIEKGLFGSGVFDESDSFRERKGEYGEGDPAFTSPELEAIRQQNIEDLENIDKMDSSPKEVKTPKGDDDEPEVTMTDLEKALGLDKARQEYAADALAAASKAFFEGKGFGAIADAAAVKSKAPDIKRLAGLEEFKAQKAKELYKEKLDAQARAKAGTIGNLQKDIQFLKGLRGADRIAALGKLGYKAPSLSAAIKELKITGQAPDAATIINLAELYIGPDFKGVVDVTEELSNKPAGTYIASDGSALVIIDEQGKSRLQKL